METRTTKPVVLLLTAERWTSTARLALALRSADCDLHLLAPGDHPASVCGAVMRSFRYDPLRPLNSLRHALRSSGATTVLPADETVARQLGELWMHLRERDDAEFLAVDGILTRSLGDPARLAEVGSRMALQRAAEAEAIATPATREIADEAQLPAAIAELGLPLVLKADASSGGRGVRVVDSLAAAQMSFRRFAHAPRMSRAVLRGVIHRDWTHLRRSARRERCVVTAQHLVKGVERNAMVLAKAGRVLALQMFEVVHTWKLRGPSSVLRRIDDPHMESAIHKLVHRLEATGFCGFDFMIDDATGESLLLERNARPTQVAHLSFGLGHDLIAAYAREFAGLHHVADRAACTGREQIALFPQELQRDPESTALRDAFHDVPWESPALMKRVLRNDPKLRKAVGDERVRGPRQSETAISLQAAP